jgi:hypothetical protein
VAPDGRERGPDRPRASAARCEGVGTSAGGIPCPTRPTLEEERRGEEMRKIMDARLTELQELYTGLVNAAVAEDRMDLVQKLNDEYVEESLRLMLAAA